MDLKVLMCVLALSLPHTSATVTCEIEDRHDCRYKVICEHHAGNAWTPECDYEPYVTFIITKSNVDTLTAGFFGSTNFDSRVRAIKAIANSWTTLESFSFRYYSKTIEMDLSANKIENIKSEAFKNLIYLKSLNISNNAIQSLNPMSFLISDSRNTDLEILDLSNNMLNELTGEVFSNLPRLKQLFLQNNRLVTLTEDCLGNVKDLLELDLKNNLLSSLNMTLINLKSLKNLDISYNQLTKIMGYEINRLSSLEVVNISHNAIEIVESNCFNQAFNLAMVDLSHNVIQSPIENLMFINNNKLVYLDFYENNITQIQDNAFQHTKLSYLNLEKNNLTGEITQKTFSGLQNITSLNLCNQSLTALRNNAFSDAVNLVYLNLSQNSIKLIENSSFAKASSLNILDISHNNVSDVNFLRNSLFSLTELYLRNNSLLEIPKNAFDNQTALKKIDVSSNLIKNIESNSLPLKSLQYLNVTDNRLVEVLNSNVFSGAKLLRYLDLSNFNLSSIDKMALVDLPVLARLNISHNQLEYIDPNNFFGMDNMYSLDISYNRLSCFHLKNGSLSNLKALYLNNNNLSNISRTLINMTGLLYVDLSNNNISNLSDVPFSKLTNLKVLHISYNKIKIFNGPQVNTLSRLTDLSLGSNDLSEINLSYFKDLVIVDISFNKLSFFDSSLFENLDYLQSIDLSGNNITQINPGTFQSVKILKLLNLSRNLLSSLRYGSFRGLHRTEVLDLSYNNISDIDVDVFHECVELKRLTIDYNHLKTLDVERLISTLPELTSISLGGNPLSCKEIVRNIKSINRSMLRQVEVTSIDKIFHEDNVHGIKCGDTNRTSNVDKPVVENNTVTASTYIGLVIWCTILTIIVLAIVGSVYMYKRKQSLMLNRESRLQIRASLSEFSGSETHHDWLG